MNRDKAGDADQMNLEVDSKKSHVTKIPLLLTKVSTQQ